MGKKYHISERRISFAFINYRRGLNGRNRIASQGDRPITSGRYRLSVCISSLINGWLVIYDKIGFDFLLFPSHLFFIHTFLIYTRIPSPAFRRALDRRLSIYIHTPNPTLPFYSTHPPPHTHHGRLHHRYRQHCLGFNVLHTRLSHGPPSHSFVAMDKTTDACIVFFADTSTGSLLCWSRSSQTCPVPHVPHHALCCRGFISGIYISQPSN